MILFGAFSSKADAQTVTVDNYYNQEVTKDGKPFHYLWTDTEQTGFSIFGESFKKQGAKKLTALSEAPTLVNLKNSQVYIIVDADNVKDNPKPNPATTEQANAIAEWVKQGGSLFLMGNDKNNADLATMNAIATKFGLKFNDDLILHVTDDDHFDDGGVVVKSNPLFKTASYIFMKDACSISGGADAKIELKDKQGNNAIVSVKYGKGKVLAVGDPWLYNEYVNGRLPKTFDNDKAANDIAAWLLKK